MNWQILVKKPRCLVLYSCAFAGLLLVSACGGGAAPFAFQQQIIPKTETVSVPQGQINIPPPLGFCKEGRGSYDTETSAFIIFANCGYLNTHGRRAAPNAGFSGLMTTSIAKVPAFNDHENIDIIVGYLESDEGLATLSASGDAQSVSIVDTRKTSDGVFLQLRDSDAELSQNVWKSFLNRSGHLVAVTLMQKKADPLTSEQAMQFLQGYSDAIYLSNKPVILPPGTPVQQNPTPIAGGQQNQLKKVGLLRRLLF